MSYTPTNWKAGDTVTSAKLNKMEQGIANNILIVEITTDEETEKQVMNKTWQEIFDADYAICVRHGGTGESYGKDYISISGVGFNNSQYSVIVNILGEDVLFTATSADEYPREFELPK